MEPEGTAKYTNDATHATLLHEMRYNCDNRDAAAMRAPVHFFYMTKALMTPTNGNPAVPDFSTPADKVIDAFRGVRATARALGRNPSSISRWRKPVDEGGTGGRVPGNLQAAILEKAKAAGLKLSAEDLIVATVLR